MYCQIENVTECNFREISTTDPGRNYKCYTTRSTLQKILTVIAIKTYFFTLLYIFNIFSILQCVTSQRISLPVARTKISCSGLHDIALMPLPTSPTLSICPDATFHNKTLPVSVATHTDCWSGRNSIPTILLTPSGGSSSH